MRKPIMQLPVPYTRKRRSTARSIVKLVCDRARTAQLTKIPGVYALVLSLPRVLTAEETEEVARMLSNHGGVLRRRLKTTLHSTELSETVTGNGCRITMVVQTLRDR